MKKRIISVGFISCFILMASIGRTSAQTIETDTKKEIFLVYFVSFLEADTDTTDESESSIKQAFRVTMSGYQISQAQLIDIIKEGERKEWKTILSPMAVSFFIMKSRDEGGLTFQRLKEFVNFGKDRTVCDLSEEMTNESGNFDNASMALARKSDAFSRQDVTCVVKAYVSLQKNRYFMRGSSYVAGYNYLKAQRFEVLLGNHKPTVRSILEQNLRGDIAWEVGVSAYLLALYGNQQSIPKLKNAALRYSNDQNIKIMTQASISFLQDK